MLVIKFLSKYLVSIKSAVTKQRHVDESRESGKNTDGAEPSRCI